MDYPTSDASIGLINGKFADGNPAGGVPASRDPAKHMNAVSDEIINAIAQSGLTPAESNLTQLYQAMLRTASGAQSLNISGWQRLPGGLILQWMRPSANFSGGATPTINWPMGAFPNACLFALAGDFGLSNMYVTVDAATAQNVTLRSNTAALSDAVSILGIGY